MFQRTYTSKTDVWSAGATLYVLVAGYPADRLQETFNILQSSKAGRLRGLPNLPDNMPESFYDMLEGALAYRHKQRMDAEHLMAGEFPQFHIHHRDSVQGGGGKPGTISIHEIAAEAASAEFGDTVSEIPSSFSTKKTTSFVLEGSVRKHTAYLGYQKFERSVTALLATMLSKDTCSRLLSLLREHHGNAKEMKSVESGVSMESTEKKEDDKAKAEVDLPNRKSNAEKLQIVTINVLLELLGGMQVGDPRELGEV